MTKNHTFIIDHNVPSKFSTWLINKGYRIIRVADINPEMTDQDVAKLTIKENGFLITNDCDFVNYSQQFEELSVILFSFHDQSSAIRISAFEIILPRLSEVDSKRGNLIILKKL